LDVKGSANLDVLHVETSDGVVGLRVSQGGYVSVQLFPGNHGGVCQSSGLLSLCNSAAEYVPSIDSGVGFPETADLASIAPAVSNPSNDEHSPFVVAKSSVACDPNLLGIIADPSQGADGEKKNEHYLPLSIFGYFPAKVTMENGFIHRGDAITSSSKAGYGMKATGACKIIGYALEDASTEGTIQVFANVGESSASAVTELSGKVDMLTQENETLKAELAALDARLSALENATPKVQASNVP
jgi:uncharacterized small protein (DUF1192 family)